MNLRSRTAFFAVLFVSATLWAASAVRSAPGESQEIDAPVARLVARSGASGGLCVQVGCDDLTLARRLARTGRFLVQLVDPDAAKVAKVRKQLQSQGLYGLITAVRLHSASKLPYSENLVNVLVVAPDAGADVPTTEMARVLRPGGVVLVRKGEASETGLKAAKLETTLVGPASDRWALGRKPWPAEMDEWTHPRHAADGNAVSRDMLVGPPRRIRWVTGPSREISNFVSAGGRNHYGGVWARDAFNGLRLWQRELNQSPAEGGSAFRYAAARVRPVVAGERLFVVADGSVVALHAASGEAVMEYPEAGKPSDLLHAGGLLLAVDGRSVRALAVDSGALRWKHEATKVQYVIASDEAVFLLEGAPQRGEKLAAVSLDLQSGQVRWRRDDYPWLAQVRRTVCHGGLLVFEVSTLKDDKEGNWIHVVSAADGKPMWSRNFVPGMNHVKQARALFIGDLLWVLEDRQCVGLDPQTGKAKCTHKAGFCHCFPPVATSRFMLAGEMELTDLATGRLDANRITKAACGRDFGWVPANGLIYVSPKHCVCWPMLRGYAAMAPALPDGAPATDFRKQDFVLETGVDPPSASNVTTDAEWPCYRHDAWRTGGTMAEVPTGLSVLWTATLGGWPEGLVTEDWKENPFVHGPVTAPVVAGGAVYVARPDAHQVVALDSDSGELRWRYTANGRIDTAPTIHRGLCLFGTKSGWVCCLRADDGQLVWRLRAAPSDAQMVAYGQVESPWPVPGSVLVVDEVAYFAAGRQPLADGGILLFAVEPATGSIHWVKRLDTVPTQNFYGCTGLEYDNFDLLHREGESVAMSRWLFHRTTGDMTCKGADAFALLNTGGGRVAVPRGCWTYAPRHQPRHGGDRSPVRPLAVFRDATLMACLHDHRTLYRRDFNLNAGESFDTTWITGWAASQNFRKKEGEVWRSDRLARNTKWKVPVFSDAEPNQQIAAVVLAGGTLWVAGSQGRLIAISVEDGNTLSRTDLPAPVWDGMAAAGARLFVSIQEGGVVCLGKD